MKVNINQAQGIGIPFSQTIFITLLFLMSITLIIWFGLTKVENRLRQQTVSQLQSVLDVTQKNLQDNWYQRIVKDAQRWTHGPEFLEQVQSLLKAEQSGFNSLDSHETQRLLDHGFKARLSGFEAQNIAVISKKQVILSSTLSSDVGSVSWLANNRPEQFSKVFLGLPQFISPLYSNKPKLSEFGQLLQSPAEMYILIPVFDSDEHVIACLSIRLDPYEKFSHIAQASFFGDTAETYFFSKEGLLLTKSRYVNFLRTVGRLKPDESAILGIKIHIPNGVSEQTALTFMAREALNNGKGSSFDGYLNYRGVKVLGAWTWDPLLDIGLVTEIDESEALTLYKEIQKVILKVFILFLSLLCIGIIIQYRLNRKARRSIEHSEKYLRSLLDNILDGVITCTRTGELVSFSHTAESIFGYQAQEVIGSSVCRLFPDKKEGEPCFIADHNPQTYIHNVFTDAVNNLGQIFPIRLSVRDLIIDAQDLYLVVVQDFSKIKQAEQRLHDSNQQLAQMANLANSAIIMFDHQGIITFWNRMAKTMFGWTSAEAIGAQVCKKIVSEDNEASLSFTFESLRSKELQDSASLNWEIMAEDHQGKEFPVEISATMHNVAGQSNSIAIINDISKRRGDEKLSLKRTKVVEYSLQQLENSRKAALSIMQDANNQKQRAEHALKELAISQDKLHFSKDIAEAASRSKSTFLATMSHELRTPMNAIIGMSKLALKTNLDAKQHNYIEKVNRSAESLLGILNDILDFSKIEAGKLELECIEFCLDDVLTHLVNLIGLKAENKGLELIFDIEPGLLTHLKGDPLRLSQILVNLCSNAVKFTHSGFVCLSCKSLANSSGSVVLQFTVEDTGIGISPEKMSFLFKAFTQADDSTSRQYGGTGLGLVITQNLVELLNGELQVDSCLGEGSIFSFSVEFGISEIANNDIKELGENFENDKVLVVEQNVRSLNSITNLFMHRGIEVGECNSAEQALILLAQSNDSNKPFSMVIITNKIVEISPEFVKNAKAINEKCKCIILQSALGEQCAIEGACDQQFDLTLEKPVIASSLFQALHSLKHNLMHKMDIGGLKAKIEHKTSLKGSKVLVVEDNDFNQELLKEWLSDAGIIWTIANNGKEAIELLEHQEFQAVLMDIQMPIMDGLTATKLIRQQERYMSLPILAMTAGAMLEDRQAAMQAGMNDYISKPVSLDKMFDVLAKWIRPIESTFNVIERDAIALVSEDVGPEKLTLNYFDGLHGIDLTLALQTAQGDFVRLTKLIRMFYTGQCQFIDKFIVHLEAKELDKAHILAHTLKGIAGYLGIIPVVREAQNLVSLCKVAMDGLDNEDQIRINLKLLKSHLNPVISSMKIWIERLPEEEKVCFDLDKWRTALSLLQQQLSVSDADSVDTIELLLEMAKKEQDIKSLELAKSKAEVFDFDAAVLEIINLTNIREISNVTT